MKKIICLIFVLCCLGIGVVNAQYKVLINFNNGNYPKGFSPYGSLIISGSKMYGMTQTNIFSVDTNGSLYKDLHDFIDTGALSLNGWGPTGSLTISGDILYGMTNGGGAYDSGCIFKIDTNGTGYKKLFDFGGNSGAGPIGDLTLSGGVLYGMAQFGGAYAVDGNIFSIDTNGSGFKDLFDFNGLNGSLPRGNVIISGNKLYGLVQYGGANDSGSIFSISTNGSGFKDLFDFSGPDGANPTGSLIISGNLLFGMTNSGGKFEGGNIFSIDTNGLVFTDLYDFNDSSGGIWPENSLVLSGGLLYGVTGDGGKHLYGNIFSIAKNGTNYTDLYQFRKPGGTWTSSNLTPLGSILYGMSWDGGTNGYGVIYSYNYSNPQGINEVNTTSETIKVFPNPTNGKFTIQLSSRLLSGVSGQSLVEIYNELGQIIYTQTLRQAQGDYQIDLSNQPAGIYLYRVITHEGELVGTGKLIKE